MLRVGSMSRWTRSIAGPTSSASMPISRGLDQPCSLNAVLIGGAHDGAEISTGCRLPPLTIGVLSCTGGNGDGRSCYDQGDINDGFQTWSCWKYAGLARDAQGC